jgi:hypothetical protein
MRSKAKNEGLRRLYEYEKGKKRTKFVASKAPLGEGYSCISKNSCKNNKKMLYYPHI